MTEPITYFWLFLFVLISVGILQLVRIFLERWLRWDAGDRERVLQAKMGDLQRELDKAKERVVVLEKQIELLLGQYNDAIIRLNSFKVQYEAALEDARNLRQDLEDVRREMPQAGTTSPRRRVLISVSGSKDPSLELDLASLRAVQMDTGLDFERVLEADPDKVKKVLDRQRMLRNHTYVHMSVYSDQRGYLLGDKIVDANWLSGVLGGVIVLVVAGSNSDWIGDLLGVVQYVVTMSEEVDPRDAALFARAFWTEIGKGLGPSRALETALQRAPSTMREYIVRHWSE